MKEQRICSSVTVINIMHGLLREKNLTSNIKGKEYFTGFGKPPQALEKQFPNKPQIKEGHQLSRCYDTKTLVVFDTDTRKKVPSFVCYLRI